MRRLACLFTAAASLSASIADEAADPLKSGRFRWKMSEPLVSPADRPEDPCHSVKDPSVVFFEKRWHLFTTIRSQKRSHQIEYSNFTEWSEAGKALRHILKITDGYFCAPQVFYFTPHQCWYLLYQTADPARKPSLQPAYSTTKTLGDPASWSKPVLLYPDKHPETVSAWIDFWIICDAAKAHLFFTSNNGLMWRAETGLDQFPRGWTNPQVGLRDRIFEASHTYKIKGRDEYLTVVEQDEGRRYYKAYTAARLDGDWQPLAASAEQPFASLKNITTVVPPWAESVSHGELLRSGWDEKMEIDPVRLRFLFQGVTDARRAGKKYGEIPWQLGLLEQE